MAAQKHQFLWLFVVLVSCSTFAAQPALEVNNPISDCLYITNQSIRDKSGTLHLAARLDFKKPIGYCGCKSAMVSYHTYIVENELARRINAGTFNSLDSRIDTIELAKLNDAKEDQTLKLLFGCAVNE
ncbi:DUF2195 family protein [Halioxenophilus aromaticivorans]